MRISKMLNFSLTAAACFAALHLGSCGQKKSESAVPIIQSDTEFRALMADTTGRLIVFDLYADWCQPCRMLSPMLESIAQENAGRVWLYKINVDKYPAIARQFSVSGIPHVVFLKNGQVLRTLTGLNPSEAYVQAIVDFTR
jgi:thioredoxin